MIAIAQPCRASRFIMRAKPDKIDRAFAKEKLILDAMTLIGSGQTVETVAATVGVPVSRLTEWICRYRRYGWTAFVRRPHRDRPPLETSSAVAEALRREKLVKDAYKLMADGLSQKRAADKLDIPMAQLSRWRRAYEESGFTALLPRALGFGPKTSGRRRTRLTE